MAHSVVHFELGADAPERLIGFYGGVFGWRFEPWGPPGFWRISCGEGPGVTEGALVQRTRPRGEGTPSGFRCTITVADFDAMTRAIEQHGGTLRPPAVDIPGVGKVIEFVDPEGNLACVMRYADGDPRAIR